MPWIIWIRTIVHYLQRNNPFSGFFAILVILVFILDMTFLPLLDQLSHATIITGNISENLMRVKTYLKENNISYEANPDVICFESEQLLMNDALSVIQNAQQTSFSKHRMMILAVHRIGHDVQNKLLKTLEEPHPGTHFILLVPNTHQILDTIISRTHVILGVHAPGASRLTAEDFLSKSLSERFDLVETWAKNKKDENNLDKSEVIALCDSLEKKIWKQGNRDEQLFTDISMVREYAAIRGASHRVLLDFLAIRCPVLK